MVYLPHHFQMPDVDGFLDAHPTALLVTAGPDGTPLATLLPYVRDGDRLLMHVARANDHWRSVGPGAAALAVVLGAQAYVSPSAYASKAEHGRVVPTWNYSAVHLTGRAVVHDDPDWVRDVVTRLTVRHEGSRDEPWAVTDAPERYVAGQLKAIVGIELVVERVEAKAKLSQNRDAADRAGVLGIMDVEAPDVAAAMRRLPD